MGCQGPTWESLASTSQNILLQGLNPSHPALPTPYTRGALAGGRSCPENCICCYCCGHPLGERHSRNLLCTPMGAPPDCLPQVLTLNLSFPCSLRCMRQPKLSPSFYLCFHLHPVLMAGHIKAKGLGFLFLKGTGSSLASLASVDPVFI